MNRSQITSVEIHHSLKYSPRKSCFSSDHVPIQLPICLALRLLLEKVKVLNSTNHITSQYKLPTIANAAVTHSNTRKLVPYWTSTLRASANPLIVSAWRTTTPVVIPAASSREILASVAKVSIVKTTNLLISMRRRAEPARASVPAMIRMRTRAKMTLALDATTGMVVAMACFTAAIGGTEILAAVPTSMEEGMELVVLTICPRPFVLSEYDTHLVVTESLSGFSPSRNLPWQILVT